ncbi:hypothetical protein GCM10009730_33180 [Streptomyces albidochromogenes]|uniref:hypothetical protein n=1 Tax=Streptomyces albidochromogenes TaxID=329524 RepID=UPI001FCC2559|nr:hypothetical protein [Streptomyces albidochromogenes]
MKRWIDSRLGKSHPGHEVNLVFVRGLTDEAVAEGLGGLRRRPLETGAAGGWT